MFSSDLMNNPVECRTFVSLEILSHQSLNQFIVNVKARSVPLIPTKFDSQMCATWKLSEYSFPGFGHQNDQNDVTCQK